MSNTAPIPGNTLLPVPDGLCRRFHHSTFLAPAHPTRLCSRPVCRHRSPGSPLASLSIMASLNMASLSMVSPNMVSPNMATPSMANPSTVNLRMSNLSIHGREETSLSSSSCTR